MDSIFFENAFKSIEHLNEESVRLSDVDTLKDIIDVEEDENPEQTVIDLEAETEDDVQDSYIGKVICQCGSCRSLVYMNQEDLSFSEEDKEDVDINEDCPNCGAPGDEFKVVGKVVDFYEEPEIEVEVEDKYDIDAAMDADEDSISEGCVKAKRLKGSANSAKRGRARKLGESLKKSMKESFEGSKSLSEKEKSILRDAVEFYFDGRFEKFEEEEGEPFTGNELEDLLAEMIVNPWGEDGFWNLFENDPASEVLESADSEEKEDEIYKYAYNYFKEKFIIRFGKKALEKHFDEFDKILTDYNSRRESEKKLGESLKEGLENIQLETEDKVYKVSEEKKEPTGDEMIVPLSDEEAEDIENFEEPNPEPFEEPIPEEEPEEDEFKDIDIEDIDEDAFDELGESFLKRVYENVKSFKSTDASMPNENSFIMEGLITFNSGKTRLTKFTFNSSEVDKNNNVKFTGLNEDFSSGKKAFKLTGRVSKGKLIPESLKYNFRIKLSEDKSQQVYGKVALKENLNR